jgi:hypothetical protein
MKRPLPVTLISFTFIIAGISGIVYHGTELKNIFADPNVTWVFVVRLAAVAGGVYALRGNNWARWLLVSWIAYHIFLSFYHTMPQVAIHVLFALLTVLALFNKKSNSYFKGT